MSKQKKPSPERMNAAQQAPLPTQKRQPAAARTAGRPKEFRDEPMVQQPLFQLDQGGAR